MVACRSEKRMPSWVPTCKRVSLARAGLAELVAADPVLGPDAAALVRPGVGVLMRTSRGAAGPAARDEQVASYRTMLVDEMTAIRDFASFG